MGTAKDVKPMSNLQLSLTEAILAASFMKPPKRGNEEHQSKHSVFGQCLEVPVLREFWKYLQKENTFGGGDTNVQSLHQLGLVKI